MPPDPAPRPTGATRRKGEAPAPRTAATSRADLVARVLAADILDGRRAIGGDLPAEADLAAAHGCSVAAVRTALRDLEGLGLIARSRGEAARVIAGDIRAHYAVAAQTAGPGGDYVARTKLLIERQRPVVADAELAQLLDAAEGTKWLRLGGLRLAADAVFGPLSCVDAWIATRAAAIAPPETLTPEALETLLKVSIVEMEEQVAGGVLTPAQARSLRARGGAACLSLLRRYRRRGGAVVAVVRDTHPAERAGVLVRLRRL